MAMWSRMSTARWVGGGCAVALLTASLAGCGSANAAGGADVITPAQARTVAQAYLHSTVPSQIDQERGSLQRIDKSVDLLRTPGPAPTPDSRTQDATVWVPHQSQYPITFLCLDKALMGGGQTSPGQFFRFSKASATAAWTVTHQDSLVSIGSRPAVALDSAGYAQLAAPQDYGKFLVSPAKLAHDWAAYLAAGNATDAREFAPGNLTSGAIQGNKQQIANSAKSQFTLTYSYVPTDDPVDAYVLKDGSVLVLVGIQQTAHTVAGKDPIKVTGDGKGVTYPAAGSYRDLTQTTLVLAAFTIPPKGSAVKVSGIAVYDGPVSATATRA